MANCRRLAFFAAAAFLEYARGLTGVVIISFSSLLILALFLAKHVNYRRCFAQIEALLGRPSND
jgi:hypothetical protein